MFRLAALSSQAMRGPISRVVSRGIPRTVKRKDVTSLSLRSLHTGFDRLVEIRQSRFGAVSKTNNKIILGAGGLQTRGVAGPVARIVSQLLIMLTSIMGRAFMQAFAEAKARAAKDGGKAATQTILRRGVMEADEAYEILNLKHGETDMEKVNAQYEKYFEANDPAKGGSLYLQSKIYRAKECLDNELKKPKDSNSA